MSGLWGWVPFVGGVVIIIAVAWAILRNKQDTSARDEAHTERATRENYDRQDAEDKARDDQSRL